MHQAHHRRGAFARTQRAREQPVVAPDGDRQDLILDPVVVSGQIAVVDLARRARHRLLGMRADRSAQLKDHDLGAPSGLHLDRGVVQPAPAPLGAWPYVAR